jgi:hypothetical protein
MQKHCRAAPRFATGTGTGKYSGPIWCVVGRVVCGGVGGCACVVVWSCAVRACGGVWM